MSLSKLHSIGLLTALIVFATPPVFANETVEGRTDNRVTVSYGDLNLQSQLGARTLVTRISNAARRACGERPRLGPGFYVARARYAACVNQAEEAAIATVNQPNVTAVYALGRGSAMRIAAR